MAITLISREESFEREIYGVPFQLRRAPADLVQEWRQKTTTRGKENNQSFLKLVLDYAVLWWGEGINLPRWDESSKTWLDDPVPFDAARKVDVLMQMPDPVLTDIVSMVTGEVSPGLDPTRTCGSSSKRSTRTKAGVVSDADATA